MCHTSGIDAAEQARRKGDLNGFAKMFGVEIDLDDNEAIRDAVVRGSKNNLPNTPGPARSKWT
jgi:hypothetical protein